jgi:hypothetical protein
LVALAGLAAFAGLAIVVLAGGAGFGAALLAGGLTGASVGGLCATLDPADDFGTLVCAAAGGGVLETGLAYGAA